MNKSHGVDDTGSTTNAGDDKGRSGNNVSKPTKNSNHGNEQESDYSGSISDVLYIDNVRISSSFRSKTSSHS